MIAHPECNVQGDNPQYAENTAEKPVRSTRDGADQILMRDTMVSSDNTPALQNWKRKGLLGQLHTQAMRNFLISLNHAT